MPSKRTKKNPAQKIHHYLESLVKEGAGELGEKKIHRLRVLSRRIEVVFRLFENLQEKKSFLKIFKDNRKLRRRLGRIRELDVHLKQWEEIARDKPYFQKIQQEIKKHRQQALETFLKKFDLKKIQKALLKIQKKTKDADVVVPAGFSPNLLLFVDRILKNQQSYGQTHELESMHRVRIDVKRLRYALQELGEILDENFEGLVPEFKGMQKELGRIHDLETMQDFMGHLIEKQAVYWGPVVQSGLKKTKDDLKQNLIERLEDWDRQWPARRKILLRLKKEIA